MSYNNSSAGKKPASFSLFYGSTQGDAKNTSYPFKRVISSLDKLVQVAAYDHVGCRFRTGENNRGNRVKAYRSNRTFYSADVIIMDVDNVSANQLDADLTEADWMTPANVAAAFPDVPFYVVYSRHHMQEKNGKSPRPKFHVYFPLYREITDYMELEDLKRKVQRMFPAFDPNAIKVTQFMFGVQNPKAEYYEGSTRIDQFIKNDEKLPEVIQEGHRNETLSKYAGKIITRLGDTAKAREAFDKAAEKCCPPLDSEELNTIWRSAQSFFHTTVETSKGYVEPDDYASMSVFGLDVYTAWFEALAMGIGLVQLAGNVQALSGILQLDEIMSLEEVSDCVVDATASLFLCRYLPRYFFKICSVRCRCGCRLC